MFKSIYWRMVALYWAILFVVLVSLAVIMSTMYRNQSFEKTKKDLTGKARYVADLTENYYDGGLTAAEFAMSLNILSHQEGCTIWVVNQFRWGLQFPTDGDKVEFGQDQEIFSEDMGAYMERVLEGSLITYEGNFADKFDVPMLTVGVPYLVEGTPKGAVFLHTRVADIERGVRSVRRLIWISAILAAVLGGVLIFLLFGHVTRPLKQMNRAVREIARGNFGNRVEVKSRDEIGQLAQSFNAMAEDLGNLEEMRRSFVANVSHELRSPMTSIQGFVQGMLDGTIPPEEHQHYLTIVHGETQRLTGLIRDLLDLSRMESGDFPMNMENFDINELIRRTLITFEVKIDEKALQLDVDFKEDPCFVYADSARIQQVVQNLLDNAMKFTNEHGKIKVWTYVYGKKVYVSVKDDGAGISGADLPYVFERFYKAEKAHVAGQGTGLGLSIVKKILSEHDQKIWVTSSPGKGAEFTFTLAKGQSKGTKYHNLDTIHS
ncbi:sensor histidine kinase [Gehongia tenuis]|uniref:histidine kinase n=1 Tax=Gehongia tenuis TaxID=2763655 RepID=A0A926D2P0_9FIRM|nr:HAMP domain-containing sensor histidine kinase [Gehongia tenuis]MBC8530648.1 HAMP domain-containing histidine kinase [Gehongia tenuis]